MKVLFLNSVYGQKSTGSIVKALADYATDRGHEAMVLYGRGKRFGLSNARRTQGKIPFLMNAAFSRLTGRFWSRGSWLSTRRIIKTIRVEKPDVVNIHQLYGYYLNPEKLLSFLRREGIPTVITLHDFTLMTGKCGYPLSCRKYEQGCGKCPRKKSYPASFFFDRTSQEFKKKIKQFSHGDFVLAPVSQWLETCARASLITNRSPIVCVPNGIDTDVFCFRECKREDRSILVVCSNFADPIKGGAFLVDIINIFASLKEKVSFDLVGANVSFVLERVDQSMRSYIRAHGILPPRELSDLYSKSTITFVPSLSETYSLPTVESLCCGTPVYGARGIGAPEYLFDHPLCNFAVDRDPTIMANFLLSQLKPISAKQARELSTAAKAAFDQKKMLDSYYDLFERCVNYGKK